MKEFMKNITKNIKQEAKNPVVELSLEEQTEAIKNRISFDGLYSLYDRLDKLEQEKKDNIKRVKELKENVI